MTCIFCTDTEIQSRIVYKDNLVFCFLTNIPIVQGHILVCPKRHIETINELTDAEWTAIKDLIIKLKKVLEKSFGAEGFNLASNEGQSAGQSVGHLHFHLLPRKSGDTGIYEYDPRKFLYRPGSRSVSPSQELSEIVELLKSNLNS